MKNLIKILIISLPIILQLIECQYIPRGNHYFHDPYKSGVRYTPNRFNFDNHQNGYNIYRNFNNDYKSGDKSAIVYEKPETLHYYYKHKPIKPIEPIVLPVIRTKSWTTVKPIHTEQFAEDYSEDEYNEPESGYKGPDSGNSYVDYEKDDQEHHSKDFKELAGKKFAALDKHSDSGHKEVEFKKLGGFKDKHLDAKKESEHSNFKKDGEYSHDRGHGFIKAWSWDRKNIKGNIEGEKSKDLAEITAGEKGAFGLVSGKGSQSHDQKGLTALAGAAGYGKLAKEDSHKSAGGGGKSDYDKEFPIFG